MRVYKKAQILAALGISIFSFGDTMDRQMDLLTSIKSHLLPFFGPRLRGVVLYGSEARNEANESSDIDVLVLLKGPVRLGDDLYHIVSLLYPLELNIGRVIEAFPVDEGNYLQGDYALHREAQREGIRL